MVLADTVIQHRVTDALRSRPGCSQQTSRARAERTARAACVSQSAMCVGQICSGPTVSRDCRSGSERADPVSDPRSSPADHGLKRRNDIPPGFATIHDRANVPPTVWVGAGSDIKEDAVIGKDAQIRAGATVYRGTRVDIEAIVGAGARVGTGTAVGRRARIGIGVWITGGSARSLYRPTIIGDGAAVGDGTWIMAGGVRIRAEAHIGDGVCIRTLAHIGRSARVGPGCTISPGVWINRGAEVAANVWIGKGGANRPGRPDRSVRPDRRLCGRQSEHGGQAGRRDRVRLDTTTTGGPEPHDMGRRCRISGWWRRPRSRADRTSLPSATAPTLRLLCGSVKESRSEAGVEIGERTMICRRAWVGEGTHIGPSVFIGREVFHRGVLLDRSRSEDP